MNKHLFFLTTIITITPLLFAQYVPSDSIYVREDDAYEVDLDETLLGVNKKSLNDYKNLLRLYQDVRKVKETSLLFKFYPFDEEEKKVLRTILNKYQQQSFSFQIIKNSNPDSNSYLMEVADRFPGHYISLEELKLLGKSLNRHGFVKVLHELHNKITPGYFVSAKEYVEKELASISEYVNPDEKNVQDAYSQLWNKNSPEPLKELIEGFPAWEKKDYALDVLGNYYFIKGEIDLAFGVWYRLLQLYPSPRNVSTGQIVAQLATAAFMDGDIQVFSQLRENYKRQTTPITIQGKKISLNQYLGEIPKRFSSAVQVDRRGFRSNLYQNGTFVDFPLTTLKKYKEVNIEESSRIYSDYENSFFPIVSEGMVYLKQRSRILAVPIETDGKMWEYKISSNYQSAKHYKSLAIAHGCVFLISPPPAPPLSEKQKKFGKKHGFIPEPKVSGYSNTIYAIDKKQGTLLWNWDPKQAESVDENVQLHYAPTIVGNKLLVSATVELGEIQKYVLCFDLQETIDYHQGIRKEKPNPPKLLWKKFICSAPKFREDGTTITISHGAALASGYGKVYYTTNHGVVSAIDVDSGEISWLNKYNGHDDIHKYNLRDPYISETYWDDSPPIVKNGKLYVVPRDAAQLFVYDCFSGALIKKFPEEGVIEPFIKSSSITNRFKKYEMQLIAVDKDSNVYIACQTDYGTQMIVLQNTGVREIKWQKMIRGRYRGEGILTDRWLYLITNRGIFQVNPQNGDAEEKVSISTVHLNTTSTKLTIHFKPEKFLPMEFQGKKYLLLLNNSLLTIYTNQ